MSILKENFAHPKIEEDNHVFAIEVGSFLWASGLMDRLVDKALIYRLKTGKVMPQLKNGIHAGNTMIWNNFSHKSKKD